MQAAGSVLHVVEMKHVRHLGKHPVRRVLSCEWTCSPCMGGLRAALSPELLPRYRQAPNITHPPLKGLA